MKRLERERILVRLVSPDAAVLPDRLRDLTAAKRRVRRWVEGGFRGPMPLLLSGKDYPITAIDEGLHILRELKEEGYSLSLFRKSVAKALNAFRREMRLSPAATKGRDRR